MTFGAGPAEARPAPARPAPARPPALERIGDHWRAVRELAAGGSGVVYEAVDRRSGERVAVKVLRTALLSREQAERFRREAELAAQLGEHPGIVAARAVGALADGRPFLVMDLVEGVSLTQAIVRGLPVAQGVELVAQVARALSYAHARGVVHRDVKPQNVLVTRDGRAKLTDFGIAKALDEAEAITRTGQVMGTPRFMAPKQALDSKRVDERADVFGLGALLYAVLTRRPPMDLSGLSHKDALRRVARCEIAPPSQVMSDVDPVLDALCCRALAREQDARPPSAAAVAEELEAWRRGDVVASPEEAVEEAAGRALSDTVGWILVALLLAVVVAFGLWLVKNGAV